LLRAGTLDLTDTFAPKMHIWISRKQPWVQLPEGIPAYRENAPTAEWLSALGIA
jgi:hypothetical protein